MLLTSAAAGDNEKRRVHYNPRKVSVIIEGVDVMSLSTFSDAVVMLIGVIYAFHLSYPTDLKWTFCLWFVH